MRFNPKGRIDTGRIRHSGRATGPGGVRGGRGGGRLPIPTGRGGLGVGGLILVVLFVVVSGLLDDQIPGLGGDPQGDAGPDRYAECRTGEDANESADCARAAVENSLVAYWGDTLPEQAGRQLRPASVQTFSGQVSTGCGAASSQVGPFYCPADETVYLDATFFPEVLEKQLGGQGGDFVEPYVLGHEYGHHIQNLLGYMSRVRTQKGPESDAVRLELQADCLAGMWTRAAESTQDTEGVAIFESVDQDDINEALDGARSVGDDRIQQRSGGRADPDGWTHGSSEQRMRWFMVGYDQGSLQACDTFEAGRL